MKHKAIIAVALALFAGAVYAKCTTQTFITDGNNIKVCNTCCDSAGQCTTVCF